MAAGRGPLKAPTLLRGKAEGIPHRYSGSTPDQVAKNMMGLMDSAKAYLEGRNPGWPGAILHGPLGRGKTSAACEVLRLFDANGYSGVFEFLYDMVKDIKHVWGSEIAEREAASRFTRPALLVVDEVGVQFDTVAERNILYSIIVRRHNDCFPVILTTNYDLDIQDGRDSFYDSVGPRVASRFEGCLINTDVWGENLRSQHIGF